MIKTEITHQTMTSSWISDGHQNNNCCRDWTF